MLGPLLFILLTGVCVPMQISNHIIKFADDMTVVGLISKNDGSAELTVAEGVARSPHSKKVLGSYLCEV